MKSKHLAGFFWVDKKIIFGYFNQTPDSSVDQAILKLHRFLRCSLSMYKEYPSANLGNNATPISQGNKNEVPAHFGP